MIMKKGPAFAALIIALTLSLSALAAGQRRNQQQQQQKQPEAQAAPGIGPQAQSKGELDAFVAVQNEQNPANKAALADAFVSKYPNSELVGFAHVFRLTAYSQLGKFKESVAAA